MKHSKESGGRMLTLVGSLLKRYLVKWHALLKEEQVYGTSNPFIKEYDNILCAINVYLKAYIEEEVKQVRQDRQVLIFTHDVGRPFVRKCDKQEKQLQKMLFVAESQLKHTLTEYEKAFLTYMFYNQIEDIILERVWEKHFFNIKKLCILFQEGQEILYTDLQEINAAYDSKTIWNYHLEQ